MQIDPIKPALKAPGTMRFPKHDEPLSNFAFKLKLCRYTTVVVKPAAPANRLTATPTVPASASRLSGIIGLPADAPVPAGERLTIEAVLAGAYTRPLLSST